jgi:hypothetical protein
MSGAPPPFPRAGPKLAACNNNLAENDRARGLFAKAETFARRALDVRERLLLPDHTDIAESLCTRAAILRDTGRDTEAAPVIERADAIDRSHGIDPPHEPTSS